MPQIVLLICAGAGLLALLQRTRARSAERGRAALCLAIIAVLHRRARVADVAGLARLGEPLPRGRRCAPFLLLAAGGLAHARRLGLVGLVLVVIMWAQDAAPVEKSNVRAIAHAIAPEPRARRPRDLHPAGDDPGAALLPARRACATRR